MNMIKYYFPDYLRAVRKAIVMEPKNPVTLATDPAMSYGELTSVPEEQLAKIKEVLKAEGFLDGVTVNKRWSLHQSG